MRVACVQTDPRLADVDQNLAGICAGIAAAEADLAVFPECALSGYAFTTRAAAWAAARPIRGLEVGAIEDACRRAGTAAVVGLLERDGDRLFNGAVVVRPDGLAGVYRKMHLPFLGVDRFVERGDLGFPVFAAAGARLGVLICYDLSFPEAARVLKLAGAQLLCVPTNWPLAAEVSCVHAPPVRAQENHLHVAVADRVGEEGGFTFRGTSRVIDASGRTLAQAGTEPAIVRAELAPAAADQNRVVHLPGAYELDRVGDRRPDAYGPLLDGG